MMDDEKVKRKRKANWSQDQLLLLSQFVLERRVVIKGRFGAGVTSKKKREAWEEICVNINASFPAVCRSTNDCEKRWYALQSQCMFEIADYKRAVAATGKSIINIACLHLGNAFACLKFTINKGYSDMKRE
jgi:hypothetical protein